MFTRHVARSLAGYLDRELPREARARVDAHLAACPSCRRALQQIEFARDAMRQLSPVAAPDHLWTRIAASRLQPRSEGHRWSRPSWAMAAVAAAALLAVTIGGLWLTQRRVSEPWLVTDLSATGGTQRLSPGDWLDTSGRAARIVVGTLGTVDVEPGARLRLGAVRGSEYRLALSEGTITARIVAPPRLFIVDTPVSTVIDLGCEYTCTVAADGSSVVRMTKGWSALEWNGRTSLIPAGAVCRTRPGLGPGMPVFEDASEAFRQAAESFDADGGREADIEILLRGARVRDTLTLWHLLSRVDAKDRERVYDRITALAGSPPGVSREAVLALAPTALEALREELAWKW
jgi:hypothetical protein